MRRQKKASLRQSQTLRRCSHKLRKAEHGQQPAETRQGKDGFFSGAFRGDAAPWAPSLWYIVTGAPGPQPSGVLRIRGPYHRVQDTRNICSFTHPLSVRGSLF